MQLTQEKKQLTDGTEVISVGQWVAVGIQASEKVRWPLFGAVSIGRPNSEHGSPFLSRPWQYML
jgi:hypothetical protein